MELKVGEISEQLKKQITDFEKRVDVSEVGVVTYVGDGVARIYGLDNCMAAEMLELPKGVFGMALNLEEDSIGAILFGEDRLIGEGDIVKRTIDGFGAITGTSRRIIQGDAPSTAPLSTPEEPLTPVTHPY